MDEAEQHHPWKIIKKRGDASEKDYLTKEFSRRLREGPIKYKLQIQFNTPTDQEEKNLTMWNAQKVLHTQGSLQPKMETIPVIHTIFIM